jgi:hypothetical protein
VRWERDGDPARVDGLSLKRNVAALAAAALLVRHYPPTGKRREAALALGGWLPRAEWDADRIAHFVKAVAKVAGDVEWLDRVNSAKAAVAILAKGGPISGAQRMLDVFGDAVVKALGDWLNIGGGLQSDARPCGAGPTLLDEVVRLLRQRRLDERRL